MPLRRATPRSRSVRQSISTSDAHCRWGTAASITGTEADAPGLWIGESRDDPDETADAEARDGRRLRVLMDHPL